MLQRPHAFHSAVPKQRPITSSSMPAIKRLQPPLQRSAMDRTLAKKGAPWQRLQCCQRQLEKARGETGQPIARKECHCFIGC